MESGDEDLFHWMDTAAYYFSNLKGVQIVPAPWPAALR